MALIVRWAVPKGWLHDATYRPTVLNGDYPFSAFPQEPMLAVFPSTDQISCSKHSCVFLRFQL